MNYYLDRLQSAEFNAWVLIGSIVMGALILLIAGCNEAFSDTIPDDKAILAIIGEAENQGYDGLKAVACGIRNRGTLKGVYGLNAPRVKKHLYSEDIEAKAIVAWETSAIPEECAFLKGADHWHNVVREGETYWTVKMKETYRYKDHAFYKKR